MWATSAFQEKVLTFFADMTPHQKLGLGIILMITGVLSYVAINRDYGVPNSNGADWQEASGNSFMDFLVDYDHPWKWLQFLGIILGVAGFGFALAGYVLL